MKRALLVLAVLTAAAGCSDSKVVVRAALAEGGQAITDLPVYLLPYDRQALMDSLAEASDEPEPVIPEALLQQLERPSAGGATPGDSAAPSPAAVRRQIQARIDSIRTARRAWRERTFAPFDSLARAKESELGLSASSDTTDARGVARVGADEGRFWLYAVYVLPESTLEWNVPVAVRGDSVVVTLTRENAREQRFY